MEKNIKCDIVFFVKKHYVTLDHKIFPLVYDLLG